MFRSSRVWHRWTGLAASLFLIVIAATGFFLATKSRFDWVRPATQTGGEVDLAGMISVEQAAEAALGAGVAQLQSTEDLDRFELHLEDRVYKIHSKEGYQEVQVDAATGEVLSIGRRNDQMLEDMHDFSYVSSALSDWGLPLVAIFLFGLGLTGLVMFFTPVIRRAKFKRQQKS
jgi:uncharacterized iron-regulated membrane protein